MGGQKMQMPQVQWWRGQVFTACMLQISDWQLCVCSHSYCCHTMLQHDHFLTHLPTPDTKNTSYMPKQFLAARKRAIDHSSTVAFEQPQQGGRKWVQGSTPILQHALAVGEGMQFHIGHWINLSQQQQGASSFPFGRNHATSACHILQLEGTKSTIFFKKNNL